MDQVFSVYLNERPRVLRRHKHRLVGERVMTYDSQAKVKKYFAELFIAEFSERHPDLVLPLHGQLGVDMTFFFAFPKAMSKPRKIELFGRYCNSYGDIDNFEKFVFDALNGHLFEDDKQIVKVSKEKRWAEDDGLLFRVQRLDDMRELSAHKKPK